MKIRRKSTLQESISFVKLDKKKIREGIRLHGRHLFRASVRLVLEYIEWMNEELNPAEDNNFNLRVSSKKLTNGTCLSLKERSILLTKSHVRSKKDKSSILLLLKMLHAFRKYPDDVKDSIASVCEYQYLGPNRVVVRQNHSAHNLYYIINGQVEMTKIEKNNVTGDLWQVCIGTLGPGDMFGEVALLHDLPRSVTVTTKTSVDLLYLDQFDFNRLLKFTLLENWKMLRNALDTFNYFKTWNESIVRECCILSKLKDFPSNEILLGDGMGMVNYVYFLLSGKCRLIEQMTIHEDNSCGHTKYQLYHTGNSEKNRIDGHGDESREIPIDEYSGIKSSSLDAAVYDEDNKNVLSETRMDTERMSVMTTTLQDIVNQWDEITQVAAILMHKPSTLSQQDYPDGVRKIFMEICQFHRGACFGLGEDMQNRRVVSINAVRCLLIPRYWLFKYNRANIWERVKVFMSSKYPSRDKLFEKFVMNERWMEYKKNLMNDVIKRGRGVLKNTTIYDVPYSSRINEKVEFS